MKVDSEAAPVLAGQHGPARVDHLEAQPGSRYRPDRREQGPFARGKPHPNRLHRESGREPGGSHHEGRHGDGRCPVQHGGIPPRLPWP